MFVQTNHDRDSARAKQINLVLEDWPIELFPLGEKATTVSVLFLNDANDLDFLFRSQFLQCFVPNWHVTSAARSPRGKVNQQDFLSAKVAQPP